MLNEQIITIVGTKGIEQKDSEYIIFDKDDAVKRIEELLDDGWGYSIVIARR